MSEVVASVSPYEVPVGCPVYKVQMCYRRPEFRKPLLEGLAGNAHSCCVYIDPQIRAADIVEQSSHILDPNAQVSLLRTQALHGDGDAVFSREIAEYAIHFHRTLPGFLPRLIQVSPSGIRRDLRALELGTGPYTVLKILKALFEIYAFGCHLILVSAVFRCELHEL